MNEMATIAREVDWTSRVYLRGGETGEYLGKCLITGKHRVLTNNKARREPGGYESEGPATVWLLDDNGKCRGDLAESPQDYAGPA